MEKIDVEEIFYDNLEYLIDEEIKISASPKAILLGGQGAVGKGTLSTIAADSFLNIVPISINGDEYRQYHPNFNSLIRDDLNFSRETQIFSNVFTEKLIETGMQNHFNMIIEGTMRNSDTPLKTAKMLSFKRFTICTIYSRHGR